MDETVNQMLKVLKKVCLYLTVQQKSTKTTTNKFNDSTEKMLHQLLSEMSLLEAMEEIKDISDTSAKGIKESNNNMINEVENGDIPKDSYLNNSNAVSNSYIQNNSTVTMPIPVPVVAEEIQNKIDIEPPGEMVSESGSIPNTDWHPKTSQPNDRCTISEIIEVKEESTLDQRTSFGTENLNQEPRFESLFNNSESPSSNSSSDQRFPISVNPNPPNYFSYSDSNSNINRLSMMDRNNVTLKKFKESTSTTSRIQINNNLKASKHQFLKYHGIMRIICKTCHKRFVSEKKFEEHMRLHTKEKPFQCVVCKQVFRLLLSLKVHMRTHTGEKPYSCHVCERKFSQSCNLKRHMKRHMNQHQRQPVS